MVCGYQVHAKYKSEFPTNKDYLNCQTSVSLITILNCVFTDELNMYYNFIIVNGIPLIEAKLKNT